MGYYTKYEIAFPNEYEHLIEELRNKEDCAQYALRPDGSCNEETKWYDHENDIKSFSKKHPEVLIILDGEGEESPDIWRKYFLNGKVQTTKGVITYEDFDPNKLV